MLITHGDGDHIGDAVVKKHNPKIVGSQLCGWLKKKRRERNVEMNKGEQQVGDIKVMVHADRCGIDGDTFVYGGRSGRLRS